MSSNDEAVRSTNDDAASCKRSAVQLGYWSDPYIQYVTKASERKPPEISRGYFARVKGVQGLVRQFLEMTNGNCQVVNLGAGSDTWFWNLIDEEKLPKNAWIEVDFAEITSKKLYQIRSRKQLLDKLQTIGQDMTFSHNELHCGVYRLLACDLRNLDKLQSKLDEVRIDWQLPTVFIAECVLVYMSAEQSTALLSWISTHFTDVLFINYEQVNMNDRFGMVMMSNLEARGCSLVGVQHCQSVDTQIKRFTENGWQAAESVDMMTVYNHLPATEIERIEKLEMLDDRDMLIQLCEHYCLCWAYKQTQSQQNLILSQISISLIK